MDTRQCFCGGTALRAAAVLSELTLGSRPFAGETSFWEDGRRKVGSPRR